MAELSNQLLPVAVLAYLAAMVGYLVEYAFGGRGAVARTAVRPARELVGASVAGSSFGLPDRDEAAPVSPIAPARPERAAPRGRAAAAGVVAVWFTALAVAAHLAVLVTRGLAAG